jgi:hypothetical protein
MEPTIVTTAGLLISAISALSGAIQAYKAAREIGEDLDRDQVGKLLKEKPPSKGAALSLAEAIIDEEMLQILLGQIAAARKNIKEAYELGKYGLSERDRIIDEANQVICDALDRIKRFNNGVFPVIEGLDLYKVSRSHGCE